MASAFLRQPQTSQEGVGTMKVKSTIYKAKTRGIEDAVEWWKPDHENAMSVREVEDLVSECLGAHKILVDWTKSCWDSLSAGQLANPESVAQELLEAMKSGSDKFRMVSNCIEEAERLGYTVDNSNAFESAEIAISQMHADLEKRWPFIDTKVIEQSLRDYRAGQFRSAKEILDELQCTGATGG